MKNFVSSEIGTLRKILIHSPDGGIGKIIPSKFKDWLYDDTVHLNTMRKEYDEYIMLLLYFLDPEKAKEVSRYLDESPGSRGIFKPDKPEYFDSDKVIDVQKALSLILEKETTKIRLVSAICAIENCNRLLHNKLEDLSSSQLAKVLITGILEANGEEIFIFPPVPNLVFTRDIGITIKDHILLSKSAKQARKRESIIAKYIFLFHPALFLNARDKVVEISEENSFFLEPPEKQKEKRITIEGGDIMMIAPGHLIVGCSERTSASAVDAIIDRIFNTKDLEIHKISIVQIPSERAQMHIDTTFTQISRKHWVMFGGYDELENQETDKGAYSKRFEKENKSNGFQIVQFINKVNASPEVRSIGRLEQLLRDISIHDFNVPEDEVRIVYSGNKRFPYSEREQWTDSCNLLALKDGVVVGYDRNDKTIEAFKDIGYQVVRAGDLLKALKTGEQTVDEIENTLILLSSAELSRARGGSHCMSMPLYRDDI